VADFVIDNMQSGYLEILQRFWEPKGRYDIVAPRGLRTREVRDVSIRLEEPSKALAVGMGRKLSTRIAAAEAIQLIGGFQDPALLPPSFDPFKDGGVFHGSYGSRTRMQVQPAISRLYKDNDSRRALVTIWDPMHDMFIEDSRDYPCTISLQFLIRNDELELHTHMRSNDVWRGLPYDIFQFTQLQLMVAAFMGIPAGPYHHHAVSLHLYETDLGEVDRVFLDSVSWVPFDLGPLLLFGRRRPEKWADVQAECRNFVAKGLAPPDGAAAWDMRVVEWYGAALARSGDGTAVVG
jgi:thymidylate synthase